MNLHARKAKGTREKKTEKRDLSSTIHKGKYQELPANDHKENERAPTKLL